MRMLARLSLLALVAVLMVPGAGRAAVYDAAAEFSASANPAGVWSYGFSATLGGAMVLDPERASDNGIAAWRTNIWLGAPSVFHNGTSHPITNSTGTLVVPAGGLGLHPGPGGQYSVLRFTAPAEGSYQVAAAFSGLDVFGTTTDVHVLTNGTSVFNGQVNGFGPGPTYSTTVTLKVGDALDILVGWGVNQEFSFDATGVSVQIVSSGSTSGCLPPPAGLVSWWPGNGDARDVVSTNQGTVVGNVLYTDGQVNQAFRFDGRSYVKVPHSPTLNPAGSFSLECWVYPSEDPTAWANLVGKWGDSAELYNQRSYAMGLQPGRAANFSITDAAHQSDLPYHTFDTPQNVITLQAWNHLVAVYDQSAGARRIYVNGLKVAERIDPPITVLNGTAPLAFGARVRSSRYLDSYFNGSLDEVGFYHRALGDVEVQALYLAGSAGKCFGAVAPVITTQPSNQEASVGASVSFNVVASGTAPLKYQWRFNGANLGGQTSSALNLAHVQLTNAGTYSVVVSNLAGGTTSSNAVLAVNRLPVARGATVVVAAGTDCLAFASVDQGSFDPDADPLTLTQNPPGPYPVGTNRVTLTVTDNHGASNACTALVVVLDQTPPALLCPADLVVTNAHDAWTSVVTYAPSASDNCSGVGRPVCDPPSGTAFGVGTHTVHCSVADAAGNTARGSFKVTVLSGNAPPVPVIQVQPLARFHGYTNLFVIAPDNRQATVVLDGSQSYDADDASFLSFWYGGTNLLDTNLVSTCVLGLGTNDITLWLDDTLPFGTNSASAAVEVITPLQAVTIVAELLQNSGWTRQQDLLASLNGAKAAFKRGDFTAGVKELQAFQNKVSVQAGRGKPALASTLIQAAQQIIDALTPVVAPGRAPVKIHSLAHQQGKMHLKFAGPAGKVYLVQASTDMVHWQTLGTATDLGNGTFDFEDAKAANVPARFYRIVVP